MTDSDDVGGSWDIEAKVSCPHCGETVIIGLIPRRRFRSDLRRGLSGMLPPRAKVHVHYDDDGVARVWLKAT